MNNKITIYELLGLVKDGQAPQRILYDSNIWIWTGDDYYARLKDKKEQFLITGMYYTWVTEFLNSEIEILDNEDEDIEDIDFKTAGTQKEKNRIMKDKINELVKEVNKLKKIDCFKSKGE